MISKQKKSIGIIGFVIGAFAGLYLATTEVEMISSTQAMEGEQVSPPVASPVKALAERDVYYPGSEDLAADEMRAVSPAESITDRA